MSQKQQSQFERLFLAASKLEGKEREAFLDEATADDADLRSSVETLLRGAPDRNAPALFVEEESARANSVNRRSLRLLEKWADILRSPAGPLMVLAFLLTTGFWSLHALNEGMDQVVEESLVTFLDDSERDISLLIAERKATVLYFAERPELQSRAASLLDASIEVEDEALVGLREQEDVRQVLIPMQEIARYTGYWISDRSGRVIASDQEAEIGGRLTERAMEILRPAYEGEEMVTVRPALGERLLPGTPRDRTLVGRAVPVVERAGVVEAILFIQFDPRDVFARLLSVSSQENDWDVVAFDENGWMLSSSIFADELIAVGLLEPGEDTALRIQLRDPGVDLTREPLPDSPPESWPWTRMAESALRGESGVDLDGYNNALGVEVRGAWRWLPEFDFGLAVELRDDKAAALTRPVKLAFWSLLALIVLVTLGMVGISRAVSVLQDRLHASKLGQYRLIEKIGEGGMGVVYRARHAMLRRATAIKILHAGQHDAETIARFEREVQSTSQLAHPNTIEVYDYGRDPRNGIFYYAMEYLDGITLAKLLEVDGPPPVARSLYLLEQVCGSLAEAHDSGMIHRDIKPLNIMICQRGGLNDVVKVLDFGLVKDVEPENQTTVTSEEVIRGTPLYIAPEIVLDPTSVDTRSDVYSLGTVAYNLLTGEEIFTGSDPDELMEKVLHADPVRPSKRTSVPIPAALEDLVMRCLSRDPEARPANMRTILAELEELAKELAWTQERAGAWWDAYLTRHPRSAPAPAAGQESKTRAHERS